MSVVWLQEWGRLHPRVRTRRGVGNLHFQRTNLQDPKGCACVRGRQGFACVRGREREGGGEGGRDGHVRVRLYHHVSFVLLF